MNPARLFKIIGSVLLALFLAFGWHLTGYLKDLGKVSNTDRLWILVVLGTLFLLQQIYLAMPKPGPHDEIEKRKALIQFYLRSAHATYYEKLQEILGPSQTEYATVRIHVMLPTHRALGLFGSYLKVYYYYCPEGVIYSPAELDLTWKKKEGTCGWAWAKNRITIYDSARPDLATPIHRLNLTQRPVVKSIKSVISFPIWHNGKVVGVLGLDSKENVEETRFDNVEILDLFNASTAILATHCPFEGVKAV